MNGRGARYHLVFTLHGMNTARMPHDCPHLKYPRFFVSPVFNVNSHTGPIVAFEAKELEWQIWVPLRSFRAISECLLLVVSKHDHFAVLNGNTRLGQNLLTSANA